MRDAFNEPADLQSKIATLPGFAEAPAGFRHVGAADTAAVCDALAAMAGVAGLETRTGVARYDESADRLGADDAALARCDRGDADSVSARRGAVNPKLASPAGGAVEAGATPIPRDDALVGMSPDAAAFARGLRALHAAADPERALLRLRQALRRERARGRAGHWTYDLARHLRLVQDVRRAEASMRTAAYARRGEAAPA